MTELRTLDDLNSNAYFEEGCAWRLSMLHKGDIKKEAIKWIKSIQYHHGATYDFHLFKEFFNITEEDLK